MSESGIESRGPNEYRWTVGCQPRMEFGLGVGDEVMSMRGRCAACGSITMEYPRYVMRGGVPARGGRDVSGEYEGLGGAPLGVGWVDESVIMEWVERHLKSTLAVMHDAFVVSKRPAEGEGEVESGS